MLVAGEAGVGKTRLVDHVCGESDALVLWGRARQGAATPYGPVVSALRALLRVDAKGLDDCGPLRDQLALILPELGEPPAQSDRPTLFEAVRAALGHVAREEGAVVALDDLQWSDEATLELLPALAESVDRAASADRGHVPLRRPAARSPAAPGQARAAAIRAPRRDHGPAAEPARDCRAAHPSPGAAPGSFARCARSVTGPRASPSSSRSSRRRSCSPTPSWPAGAASSSPAAGRCRSPTPSAMRCSSAPRISRPKGVRRPRSRPSPGRSSTLPWWRRRPAPPDWPSSWGVSW